MTGAHTQYLTRHARFLPARCGIYGHAPCSLTHVHDTGAPQVVSAVIGACSPRAPPVDHAPRSMPPPPRVLIIDTNHNVALAGGPRRGNSCMVGDWLAGVCLSYIVRT